MIAVIPAKTYWTFVVRALGGIAGRSYDARGCNYLFAFGQPRDRAHAQKLVQNAEGYLLNNFFFALASSLSWCSTASVECFAGSLWKKQINSGESA
jgi:hypothetical protein